MVRARSAGVAAAVWLVGGLGSAVGGGAEDPVVTLKGRAVLPADTYAAGPPSGAFIGPGPFNGRVPPFPGQPVQGVSALIEGPHGNLWAMPDNGYGAKENSADFLLRVYRIGLDLETARGGTGDVEVGRFISLRDPDGKVPFPIVNEDTEERLLTGADFDIESFRRDRHGDLWFGDEFGPFLLHTDRTGRVLDPPIPMRGVRSPQNPNVASPDAATLRRSQGFEGMALSRDGRSLYPMLEGSLIADPDQRRRIISQFDIRTRTYTGRRWSYRVEDPAHAIGDFTALPGGRFLVIERDNLQGVDAAFKRIFVVDLGRVDAEGFLVKREVVDLLEIADPAGISLPARPDDLGIGDPFRFPFQTIESVLPIGGNRLLVANDNNYPFSAGRNALRPDDNEFIVLHVPGLRRGG